MTILSKFHRNAILTGYVDAYCLVCESHLRNEEDLNTHIEKPIHTKNLDSTGFLDKYKEDCIRKVKKGYFCEFCNVLLSTAARVGLHVSEENHANNKGTLLLKRLGNSIVAFQDILIDENAWNGFVEDTCALCNMEFDDEMLHRAEPGHILNLVQRKVEFGVNNSVYRKIDESSFQCLTCNMVLSSNVLSTHFNESIHEEMYNNCRQNYCNLDLKSKSEKTNVKTEEKPIQPKNEVKPKITASKIPEPTVETAKKPDAVKKPTLPPESSKKTEPSKEMPKFEQDLDEELCKALDAKDYIAQDENGKLWCLLCDWTINNAMIHMHVFGRHHLTLQKMHKQRLQNKNKTTEPANEPKIKKEKNLEVDKNKARIVDSLNKFQKNDVNIYFESNTAVCKKCSKSIEFDYQAIEKHIENHNTAPPKKEPIKQENLKPVSKNHNEKADENKNHVLAKEDEKKNHLLGKEDEKNRSRASSVSSTKDSEEDLERLAKENKLTYNGIGNKLFCQVCDSRIPYSVKNIKEHVSGLAHKNKAAKIIRIPTKDFIHSIFAVENVFAQDVVINEKYCINFSSLMMITCTDKIRCQPCELVLNPDQVEGHVQNSERHHRAMMEAFVMASMEPEFIREVRAGVYHCGFCNIVQCEEDLAIHLASSAHCDGKTGANWRLQQYLPDMQQHRQRRTLEALFFLQMLGRGNIFN